MVTLKGAPCSNPYLSPCCKLNLIEDPDSNPHRPTKPNEDAPLGWDRRDLFRCLVRLHGTFVSSGLSCGASECRFHCLLGAVTTIDRARCAVALVTLSGVCLGRSAWERLHRNDGACKHKIKSKAGIAVLAAYWGIRYGPEAWSA